VHQSVPSLVLQVVTIVLWLVRVVVNRVCVSLNMGELVSLKRDKIVNVHVNTVINFLYSKEYKMALYEGFKSTNIWNAFTLNSIAAALVILFALIVKSKFDKYTDKDGNKVVHSTTFLGVIITLITTFAASFIAFTLLHLIFGYGGGQLINTAQNI